MSIAKCIFYMFLIMVLSLSTTSAQELRQGLLRQFSTLDPIYTTTIENSEVICPLFDTLVKHNPKGGVSPGVAYKWDINDAGDIYTFHLRQDNYWTDGVPVTAQDFVTTFQRIADPSLQQHPKPTYLIEFVKNASEVINGDRPLTDLGVTALDDYTVQFELIGPVSFFPAVLIYCGLSATPTHQIIKHRETWAEQVPLTTSGPYELTKGGYDGYVLERRDDHWDNSGPKDVSIHLYDNQDHILRDFLVNKLDIAAGLGKNNADWVNAKKELTVHNVPAPATVYGAFNTKLEKFQNKKVRQALSQLIDRERIATQLNNKATNTFTPDTLLYPKGNTPELAFRSRSERREIARQALKDAGYSTTAPLSVKILATDEQDFDRIASAIESSWSIPEIATEIEIIKQQYFSPRLRNNEYEFGIATWLADYPDPLTFLSILKTNGPKNIPDWGNPAYDSLLEKAFTTNERENRQELYVQMESILREEAPIAPVFHPTWTVWASDRIKQFGGPEALIVVRNVIMD